MRALIMFLAFALCWSAKAQERIAVTVDPRIELLAVVQLLSGYEKMGLTTRFDIRYKKEAQEWFAAYKNHPAVSQFATMSNAGFSFDGPPNTILYYSPPPTLKSSLSITPELISRAGGKQELARFMENLRDFADKSRFMDFYKLNQPYYQQLINVVYQKLGITGDITILEKYYGTKQHRYHIILAPLFHGGGYGANLIREDGSQDIYSIQGPLVETAGIPSFGDEKDFRELAWHEFSHSFTNPVIDRYTSELKRSDALYIPIAQAMQQQAYGDWKGSVAEHIVRAVTTRLAYRYVGEAAGNEALEYEKSRSFFYTEALAKKLKTYENSREQYPTFASFYPQLLKVFDQFIQQPPTAEFYKPPYLGSIRAVLRDKENLVLIVPKQDVLLQAYVRGIRDSLYKQAILLTDDEALTQNFAGRSLLVWGTPQTNRWLAKYNFPISQLYAEPGLQLITAWPNPQDPRYKGMVVYTGEGNLIGLQSIDPGINDYVVTKENRVMTTGSYRKGQQGWEIAP